MEFNLLFVGYAVSDVLGPRVGKENGFVLGLDDGVHIGGCGPAKSDTWER